MRRRRQTREETRRAADPTSTRNEDDRPWLTVADVARRSRVTERTVRSWISDRLLPASKHGTRVRIHPDDYEAFSRRR
jgi:excisionase family DNA binding protein